MHGTGGACCQPRSNWQGVGWGWQGRVQRVVLQRTRQPLGRGTPVGRLCCVYRWPDALRARNACCSALRPAVAPAVALWPRAGAAGEAERDSCTLRARNACCSALRPAVVGVDMAERTLLLLTRAGVRAEGREEALRPRAAGAAGLSERLRARNACCSALRPEVAAAPEAGRAEAERPRAGAAGLAERDSCALRARNSCCSALRPLAEAAAGGL